MKRLAFLIALILCLSACAELPPPADTAPPRPTDATVPAETTLPIETTVPTEPVITDFSEYEAILAPNGNERNWLFFAMGCVFETPQDIDLNYLFYLGLDHGSWDAVSPESEQYLIDNGFWREMDLQPMPATELDGILRANFGVGLDDVTIPDEWLYLQNEDFYCSNHNDAYFPSPFTITAVEDDGVNIRIYYNIEGYFNLETEEFLDCAELVLCLERMENGTIHAVSNIIAH